MFSKEAWIKSKRTWFAVAVISIHPRVTSQRLPVETSSINSNWLCPIAVYSGSRLSKQRVVCTAHTATRRRSHSRHLLLLLNLVSPLTCHQMEVVCYCALSLLPHEAPALLHRVHNKLSNARLASTCVTFSLFVLLCVNACRSWGNISVPLHPDSKGVHTYVSECVFLCVHAACCLSWCDFLCSCFLPHLASVLNRACVCVHIDRCF